MQRVKIILETQQDVMEFVNIANTISEDVMLVDGSWNRVSAKSIMGCLYSLEFQELFVESTCPNLTSKFMKFLA